MKCSILKHKSAKDNTKQFIAEVGGLKSFNSNEIADYKIFMDATKQLEQQSIRSYGVSGRPWLADDNGFTAVPNYRVLRQIDNVRKRMGLYEDKLPVGAKPSEVVKLKQEKTTVVSETLRIDTEKQQPSLTFPQFLKGKLEGSKMTTEIEGKLGADKERLIDLLGSSMYSEKLKDVVYKELLQNAFDAIKIAEAKGLIDKGKIDIVVNKKERTITFTDNGIGMTPEIVQKAFFTIGGTYKGDNVDNKLKSGGLGLAKMAFIFGSEELILETIHDGIKTSVNATSKEIRSDNFKIITNSTTEKNGTKVTVKIPESYINSKGETRSIDFPFFIEAELEFSFLKNPLIGNVDVTYSMINKGSYEKDEKINTKLGKIPEGYILFSPATTSFADIDIYIDTQNIGKKSWDTKHEILSSGLHQFNMTFNKKGGDEKIPLNIIINIKPKVEATNAQYPFNNQRENFRPTVKNDVVALGKYLQLLWHSIEIQLLKKSFSKIQNIDVVNVESPDNKIIEKNKQISKKFEKQTNEEIVRQAINDFIKDNQKAEIKDGSLSTKSQQFTAEQISKENEKDYNRTFKAERKIDVNKDTNFNLDPEKPFIHNNTTLDFNDKAIKFISEISSIMLEYKQSIIDFYGEDYSPNLKTQLWGVSIDKTYGGVNVNPSFVNMLAINPFYQFPDNPKINAVNYIAVALDHLIIHELNHNFERNEGAGFTGRFLQTYSEIHSLPNHFQLISKLKLSIKNNLETIKILNYEYKQSENVESGFEGNKLEENNQRGTSDGAATVSENDSINNARTEENDTRSSDSIGELLESISKQNQATTVSEPQSVDTNKLNQIQLSAKPSEPQYSLDTVDRKTKRKIDPEVVRQQPVLVANTEEGDLRGTVIKTEKLSNIVFNNQLAPTVNKLLEIGDPDIIFVKDLNFSTIREYSVSVSAINGVHFTDTGKIYVEFDNPNALKTVLHEAIHFFTVAKMQSNPNDPAVKKLVSLFESYQLVGSATLADTNYSKYGLKDAYEFIAEAFSNPEFVETLKYLAPSVNDNSRSFFQMFIDFVAELLGIKRDPLEEILNAGWEIIRKDLPVNRDIKGYQQMPEPSEQEEVSQQINMVESRIPINERAFKVQTKVRQDINRIISGEIFEVEEDTTRVIYSLLDDRLKQELTAEGITSENFNKNFNSQLQKLVGDSWFARILEYIKQLFTRDRLYLLARSIQTQQVSPLFTEKGKMLIYGITSNQGKKTIPLINEMLYRSITPANYKIGRVLGKAGQSLFVGKSYEDFIETISKWREQDLATNELTENKLIPEWATKMSRESYNKREDAWRLSNGLPQKHNSFKYIGRGFLDREANLIPDENGEDIYGFVNPQFNEKDIARDLGIDKTNAVMGKYAIKIGKDNLGHYIQYNDRWDLDILNPIINKVVDLTQTPFIITGKIYKALDYDPDSQVPFLYYTHDETDPNIQAYTAQVDLLNEEEFLAEKLYEISQLGIDNIYYQLIDNKVDYQLRIVTALQSDKVRQPKINNLQGFFNDIQKQGIPSNQLDLLREIISQKQGGFTKEDLVVDLLSDYSYTVEVSTSKLQEANTQYYSNLTVPGGTNYTENEIATPSITPSIKGHAQFATDKGIGWFRSDDKKDDSNMPKEDLELIGKTNNFNFSSSNPATKTRRILEVQSDLFQKGRNKKDLIGVTETSQGVESIYEKNGKYYFYDEYAGQFGEDPEIEITKERYEELKKGKINNENTFLQLLNKDSNWVTFFIKSIIQDSAKKGYEKVLFPSGNTASKVEGHTTLEEFKKQKEDRIKELERQLENPEYLVDFVDTSGYSGNYIKFNTEQEALDYVKTENAKLPEDVEGSYQSLFNSERLNREIIQLKQELERVDREGFGALKPIYNFYETTVANVLKKQGYSPKQVTDEYGNTWNEVTLDADRDLSLINFQIKEEPDATKLPSEVKAKLLRFAEKLGIKIEILEDLLDRRGVNALADIKHMIIQIQNGKEDGALAEEVAHFFVEGLDENSPLYQEMMQIIPYTRIYQEVVRQYREAYGNDTTRLKKEAMGKLIALYTSNRELAEYWAGNPSVFSAIVEWIKRFFANLRKTTKYNAFIESAERILNGDVSELSLRSKQGVYYQINNDQFSTLNNHDLSKETNIQINLNDTLFDYKKYVSGMSKDQQSKVANTNEGLKKYYETVSLTPFALELKDKIKIVGADKITIYTTMDITDALRSRLKTEFGIDKVVQVNSVQLVENDMGEIITIPKLTFAQHIANNKNAFFIDDKTIEFQKLGITIERSHVYNKRIKYTPEKVKQQKEQFQNYNEELRSRLTAAFKRISQTTLQLEAEKLYSLIVKSPRSLAVKLKEIDKKIAAMTDDELKSIFKDDFGNTNLPTQQAKKAAALLQETEKIDKGILEFISTITLLKEFFDNIAVQANKVDVNSPNFSEAQLEALIFEMFRTIKAGGVFENYADTLLLQMSGVEGTKAAQELVSSLRSSVFLAKEAIKKTSAQVLTKKLGGLLEGYDYNTKEQIKQYEAELASGQIEYTTFLFGKKKKRPMTPSERTAREADLEALKKKKPTAEQIMDVFLGRAAPFNSLTLWVKTLQNSSDPAIASIAKMLEETTQRVKVKSVQETQDFGQEVRDYMKANGITEEMIDQQLLTTETDLVYNPDTNTYDEKERLAFLNPFKNRHILVSKRRKVQELYQEYLKSQETTVGGDPDLKQQYYTEKAEFEKWKRENWYEEFTEEYYKRYDALREEYGDELFEEATGKINEINDQISEVKEALRQGLLNYKDAYSRIKDLNREKAFLRLQVNKDNTPKSEHDKKIAELLGKKVEIDIEIFEYKSNFKKFAKDFNIKMSELGIEEGHRIALTAELKQAEETGSLAGVVKYVLDNNFDDLYEWLSYNTMRVNTEEFYDERKTITDQIDIVYKKLLAVRGEKESTAIKDLWNDMFPLVKPYRDEEGNILGAEVPDYIQAQVKEINQKIEDIRESLKEGEDEIVTAEEKNIKKELNALFNKLKEIQSKAVTEDYLNEFEAQLNKSGYRQYCIDNDKAYPFSTEDYSRLADNIDFVMYIEKNKETEPELWEWFNRNHYERTIKEKDEGDFFDEYPTYTERLVYTPTYIWTQIKPTRDNFVKIIPGNKYSDRDVKDKFKTEKIEGVTFSSVTNRWLPKSAQFKNQAYFDLAQRNPRLFKLLNMLTDFHLKTQVEGLSDAKLEYFLPSIEKRKLEGNPIINTLNDFLDKNNRFEEGEGNYQQEGEKTKEKKSILTRIREEAEKFAYDNAEEETPRVNQYTKKVEEVRKRVAVPFSRYMSPDQVSRDVVSSLILFRESANHANQMKDALNTTLLFKTILEQEASQTQRVEAVKFLEDTRIFGINKVYEVGETIDNGAAKLRKLYAFGSQSDLTGFFTNIKNNLAGRMQNFLQSEFAGWSDNKAMRKAASYWKNNLFYYLAEAEKPLADRSKDWFIQTYLNPANLKDIIIYSQPGAAKRFGSQYMLSWSKHALEYSISVNALYSHLFHKEVRKGTERKTLYDIIVIKDGRMTIEDGWTDSTGRPIDEEYLIRMKTMLKSILEYVQGKVGSQTKLDTTTIGSAVLFFKSWLIPNIRKRYDKKRANYILDRDVEGYWRTFARLSLRMIINFKSYGELNWATFTEEEKASYRTAAKEMLVMALSTLLISVLFDFDLDDDDKYEKLKQKSFLEQTALLIAIQTKLETESLSAFPLFKTESTSDIYYLGIPPILTEAPKFLTNPIFGLPMLNDTWDIVEYSLKLSVNAEDAYYDKDYPMYNVEKGEAKALHHMLKVIQFDDFIYTWTNPEGRLKLYINMIKR